MLPALHLFAAPCHTGGGFTFLDFPTWYKYLESEQVAGRCAPILDFTNNPENIGRVVLAVVEIMLRLGGIVAVGFVIYGGVQYILSQGDPQKAVSARKTIINSLIGMVIALVATFIVQLIGTNLD